MQELSGQFTPADGGLVRPITVRLGDPVREQSSWTVLVEVLGFDTPFARAIHGEDWAQAIELAAMILPVALQGMARDGTLDPPFYERDPQPPDLSKLPPDVQAALAGIVP